MDKKFSPVTRVCSPNPATHFPTKPGLSITPSEMYRLMEQGIPVSSQVNASLYYDGDENIKGWDMPPERLRGVDPADLWTLRGEIRDKIRNTMTKINKDNDPG